MDIVNEKAPVSVGDKITITDMIMEDLSPVVSDVRWDADSARWRIELDWGTYGKSSVWSSDKDKVWQTV